MLSADDIIALGLEENMHRALIISVSKYCCSTSLKSWAWALGGSDNFQAKTLQSVAQENSKSDANCAKETPETCPVCPRRTAPSSKS